MRSLILVTVCTALLPCCRPEPKRELSPELQQALASFELADPDLRIELFAAEPLVADPVAMEIDENGRLYVVEMHGYPLDKSRTGCVKLLSDTDNDGFPDKSTVFADSLVLPNGVMRWKNGILVTDAPDVLYLEDTNGDGRADVKKSVLTGFALSNPQHNFNSPIFGLDNWIHLAHEGAITPTVYKAEFGDEGSDIRFPDKPDGPKLPQNASGRNVRFRPDTHELEMESGESQFGHTFDNYGRHLQTSNADHLFQEVIAARYLQRNPALLVADANEDISDHGNACEVYPITQNPQHQLLTDVGVITSACGVTWYNGGALGSRYANATFVAEPVHNLVHADRLQPNGPAYRASRLFEKKEFLASRDPWFRPVNFYVGPDGALYVVDYYRQYIEHPEWMDEETVKSGKLYNGTDKGRIYRISAQNGPAADWLNALALDKAKPADLVKNLANPSGWHRRTAQRLLLDQRPAEATALLEKMATENDSPTGRVHALWTLEGLGKTNPAVLAANLSHPEPGVRENAVKIAEMHLKRTPSLATNLLRLENDPDPAVRFQLLCTLGFLTDANAVAARNRLLTKDIESKWTHYAALSALDANPAKIFQNAVQTLADQPTDGRKLFFQNVTALIGLTGDEANIAEVVRTATTSPTAQTGWWQAASLEGLALTLPMTGFEAKRLAGEKARLLANVTAQTPPELRKAALKMLAFTGVPNSPALQTLAAQAADDQAEPAFRADVLELLSLADTKPQMTLFTQNLDPRQPTTVQQAALKALGRRPGNEPCRVVLEKWPSLTPALREEAVDMFMHNAGRMNLLLTAVADGRVQRGTVGWRRTVSLMNADDMPVRRRAREVFAAPEDRNEVMQKYQSALTLLGDAQRGLAVFEQSCATCHRMNDRGRAFGPDLASLKNRTAAALMTDILNPNRSIADGYEYWTAETTDGRQVSGVLASENASAIVLRDLSGKDTPVARASIKKLTAAAHSVMPAGLENAINPQQMADLLAFIKK